MHEGRRFLRHIIGGPRHLRPAGGLENAPAEEGDQEPVGGPLRRRYRPARVLLPALPSCFFFCFFLPSPTDRVSPGCRLRHQLPPPNIDVLKRRPGVTEPGPHCPACRFG